MRIIATVILVALAGCMGIAQMRSGGGDGCGAPGEPGDTKLISEQRAYDQAGLEDCTRTSATLYYVSENGTWYHADRTGEKREQAPNGSDSILGDSEFRVEDRQPVYVWKVTVEADPQGHGGPRQYLVNAKTGEVIRRLSAP